MVFREKKKCEKIRAKRRRCGGDTSSLEMLTNTCLGGIMDSLIFLEGLEEEDLVEFVIKLFEEDKDGVLAREVPSPFPSSSSSSSLRCDEDGYSSKNYVRKFLRALHPKWRAKVTTIKDSKDLTSLSLDELIRNDKSDRKCFRCGDPTQFIGECPKPSKDKNQRSFFEGSWSDSGEEDD
uniref:Zf-CCHC domain-containing protein/UBN2 domain-containing protein n=1 Tax=Tanacetum cinerariifolium TaxID=118510 RepID=A0A6L2MEW9_TANCI|nr:zf-CCHC domain-containing protein/UBN2 domain-containing protein [Tanacetum cinerariifolium]